MTPNGVPGLGRSRVNRMARDHLKDQESLTAIELGRRTLQLRVRAQVLIQFEIEKPR
jgi:hypothetical protein